ncbi:hypothetical protein PABG_01128 [Paracoccidioides brasiliensis Pb03]|uniref:TOM core complex subunit Tom6 n=2 Tax=Paracoccidioides brasiliensis TaxID=121759 RepID=C1GAQ6_PARBD|nr:uncharacterized protein PADG_04342 [Paracoccidioides brasiliensis Pb18]EEH18809.2 hypothetical protein PABG_01128 [Paracoccidioides brasiliensis Pb03]EEH48258.1 hypothetical protein PADG_04342 [Paracoccidioides brasiliensis Pb18]ODH41730.1 hypothetical protein ACO22_01308 [Paracoccidioides brasiliensis]ODH52361.1 hypothetical protein GX48_01424 [Paracoccidioides brasiliensis]
MAPKQRVVVQSRPAKKRQPEQVGYLTAAYRGITSSENASVVRSVVVFGAAVAFLHSSLSEMLIPQ